jgi:hypothetical protein
MPPTLRYNCALVSIDLLSIDSVTRSLLLPEKDEKIQEINGLKVSKRASSENEP